MTMWIRRLTALGALAVVLLATPAPADTYRIRAVGSSPDDFAWRPKVTHATKGSRVVWKNRSTTTHHVVAYGGNWSYDKSIAKGERVAKRFRRVGTFRFRCDLPGHSTLSGSTCSGMCGEVIVHR